MKRELLLVVVLVGAVGCGDTLVPEKQQMSCKQLDTADAWLSKQGECDVEISRTKLALDAGNYSCAITGKVRSSSEDGSTSFVVEAGSCEFLDTPLKTCKGDVMKGGRIFWTDPRAVHDGSRSVDVKTELLAVKLEDSPKCGGEVRRIDVLKTGASAR